MRALAELELRKRLKIKANESHAQTLWAPYADSPQQMAVESTAEIVGYGGAGGGGKSDALIGIPVLGHRKARIFRREYGQLDDLIERTREILGGVAFENKTARLFTGRPGFFEGRSLKFAAIQHEEDLLKKWRGRPCDFIGIDEATEWPENMVRSLLGWMRTVVEGQRCRAVLTFNPPTSPESQWLIRFFAPWLDPKHPKPAKFGEIRWYAVVDGKDVERPNGEEFQHITPSGQVERIQPQSRTFIFATLDDNPILAKSGYRSTLQALPEPLRSQLLYGDMRAGMKDDAWQVIPTAWVEAAIERGRQQGRPRDEKGKLTPLSALGVDPSRGGQAEFAIAPRYDNWFAPLVVHQGITTSDGDKGAGLVIEEWETGAVVNLDLTGVGTSVNDSLCRFAEKLAADTAGKMSMTVNAVNSAVPSKHRDRSGKFRLVNVRAAMWWKVREALDPEHGSNLCLPDDPQLKADLCAPRYKITAEGIMIEPKYPQPGVAPERSVAGRLGRSPDRGDAVVLAHWQGNQWNMF